MPRIYFIDEATGAEKPFSRDDLKPGKALEVQACMNLLKPDSLTPARIRISTLTPNEELGWDPEYSGVIGWMLSVQRKQFVWRREDGVTVFETQEFFEGVMAYLVKILNLEGIQQGFDVMAKGLKEYTEKRAKQTLTSS